MIPEHLKFGGGSLESRIHPAVLVTLLVVCGLILLLPRRFVIVPLLMASLLIPVGQNIVLGGQHFLAIRILTLTGLLRLAPAKRTPWEPIDKLFAAWALLRATAFCLLFLDAGAVFNQVAFLLDYVGGFFVLRHLLQGRDDVRRAIRTLALIALVLAACMANEKLTAVNVFGYLTGSTEVTIRDGALRAQGPFAHALLAGSFGATLLPLFAWLWVDGKARVLALAGFGGATVVTLTSASSTPVLAYAAGILGILLWPVRNHLRILRWSFAFLLTAGHLAMKAPIWFLIARIDLVGGSSGFHRAMLIDQFIRHFFDWWLIGTNSNGSWGWDMWDTCNQFVTEGYTGGFATFLCFLALLRLCFRKLAAARRACSAHSAAEWQFWLLGVAFFAHVVAFFGIVYFDQTRMAWLTLLAIVPAAVSSPPAAVTTRSPGARSVPDGPGEWFLPALRDAWPDLADPDPARQHPAPQQVAR